MIRHSSSASLILLYFMCTNVYVYTYIHPQMHIQTRVCFCVFVCVCVSVCMCASVCVRVCVRMYLYMFMSVAICNCLCEGPWKHTVANRLNFGMLTLLSYHMPIVAICNCLCEGVRWKAWIMRWICKTSLVRQLFNHPRPLEDLGITEERSKQKRPTTVSKQTYYSVKRGAQQTNQWVLAQRWQRVRVHVQEQWLFLLLIMNTISMNIIIVLSFQTRLHTHIQVYIRRAN